MAREEQPKEDLLREATALVERAQWQVEGFPDMVTAGFRINGAASFFFSEDPVYQFNEAGEFRRGYWEGTLMKATAGNLARLTRVRVPGEVQLQRYDLSQSETAVYVQQLDDYLQRLHERLASGEFVLLGAHPTDASVTERVLAWLKARPQPTPIAGRPNA